MKLKRDDRDDEAKNKNDINEENKKEEEASCHETDCCHYKYDDG